jgi:hypothetical protein
MMPEPLKPRRTQFLIIDFLKVTREPLVDALPDRTGAGIRQRDDPDQRITDNFFEYHRHLTVDVRAGVIHLAGMNAGKIRFLRRVPDHERQHDRHQTRHADEHGAFAAQSGRSITR